MTSEDKSVARTPVVNSTIILMPSLHVVQYSHFEYFKIFLDVFWSESSDFPFPCLGLGVVSFLVLYFTAQIYFNSF